MLPTAETFSRPRLSELSASGVPLMTLAGVPRKRPVLARSRMALQAIQKSVFTGSAAGLEEKTGDRVTLYLSSILNLAVGTAWQDEQRAWKSFSPLSAKPLSSAGKSAGQEGGWSSR